MDVVVTVPKRLWRDWLTEGDLPGQDKFPCYLCGGEDEDCILCYGAEYLRSGQVKWDFYISSPPKIRPGERVYIVAHGRLRGFAPLVSLDHGRRGWALVREGGANAVTIDEPIRGFQGWRYRWWERKDEKPFPDWKTEGVTP